MNNKRSRRCNLKLRETHLASMCVAIWFGGIGGGIGVMELSLVLETWTLPFWVKLLTCGSLGFCTPWVIRPHIFATIHELYGHNSIAHRIYDAVGIISALGVMYLFGMGG